MLVSIVSYEVLFKRVMRSHYVWNKTDACSRVIKRVRGAISKAPPLTVGNSIRYSAHHLKVCTLLLQITYSRLYIALA